MSGILSSLLQGHNLSEFDKLSNDGDPKHLGTIGRNLTLIGIFERDRARQALAGLEADEAIRAQMLMDAEAVDATAEIARENDREAAWSLRANKASPNVPATPALKDTDAEVNHFLKTLY